MRKYVIVIVLSSLFILLLKFTISNHVENNQFVTYAKSQPFIIAHRGGALLFPENTMIAFDGAYNLGVDMVELDVVLTKDNILITNHDKNIDRVTEGKGLVRNYTYEELKKFNFAYNFKDSSGNYPFRDKSVPVTSLEDVINKYHNKYRICIELKDTGKDGKIAASETYKLIKKYNSYKNVLVFSFDDDLLDYFKKISKNKVKTATHTVLSGKSNDLRLKIKGTYYFGNSQCLQIPISNSKLNLDVSSLIEEAHKKNISVNYWTIDDEKEIKRLIQIGADGIITDRPDIMKKVISDLQSKD